MSTYKKAVIALAIIIVAGASVWLYTSYQRIWADAVEEFKSETVASLQDHIAAKLDIAAFSYADQEQQKQAFENFWTSIQSLDLVRIKVWDSNYTVLWSNLSEIIGQRFQDNHELAEAYEGEIEFEIERQSQESISERQYKELSETYVPIKNIGGEIVGVMETYKPTVSLKAEVSKEFQKQIFIVVPLAFLGFALVVYLLRFALKPRSVV